MSILDDLIADVSKLEALARLLSVCQASGLDVTTIAIEGEPSEQWYQIVAAMYYLTALTVKDSNRAHFLELSSDPGDLDSTVTRAPGWLSAKGRSDYNTPRTQNTFATGFVTLTNGGGNTYQLRPEAQTLGNSASGKTYRNTDDPILYPSPGKFHTLAPGDSVTIPVRAEEVGTGSNAAAGEITVLVAYLAGVTATNPSAVLGTDLEPRDAYIARCRLAEAATSPNGPAAAYEYIALNTNADGTLGHPDDGKTKVNVTRVGVTRDSSLGVAQVFLASPTGPAIGGDVTAVTANINAYALPDAVTVIVAAAGGVNVNVSGLISAKAAPGLVAQTIIDAAKDAETAFFAQIPIGAYGGVLYGKKIDSVALSAHPAAFEIVSFAVDVAIGPSQVAVLVPLGFTASMVP